VGSVASWFLGSGGSWRVTETYDSVGENIAERDFDSVRRNEATRRRPAGHAAPQDGLSACIELARERNPRGSKHGGGALEVRIVEYAASVVPCPLGFHAVDIRRPVPQTMFEPGSAARLHAVVREVLAEVAALRAAMPLAWGIYSTYGRGPSLAELYRGKRFAIIIGGAYVSETLSLPEITETLGRAVRIEDAGPGYEVAFTELFGGPTDEVSTAMADGLWKLLRRASLTGLPWEVLSKL
jgi:hypothetical protein